MHVQKATEKKTASGSIKLPNLPSQKHQLQLHACSMGGSICRKLGIALFLLLIECMADL
jgi:hypothetical protein